MPSVSPPQGSIFWSPCATHRRFWNIARRVRRKGLFAQLVGGGSPRDTVSGFFVAFYKNLGNSAATMNLSFINVPDWVRLDSAEGVSAYQALLEEHEGIVRQLDESHSDAFDLLQRYRDFVAGNDLWPFFEFTVGYSSYLIGQKERGKYAPQFTEENLRRLCMAMEKDKLRPHIGERGFSEHRVRDQAEYRGRAVSQAEQ